MSRTLKELFDLQPTGQVAELLRYENLVEQDRMQMYHIRDEARKEFARDDICPVPDGEPNLGKLQVQGEIQYQVQYDPEYNGYGALVITVLAVQGIGLAEYDCSSSKIKDPNDPKGAHKPLTALWRSCFSPSVCDTVSVRRCVSKWVDSRGAADIRPQVPSRSRRSPKNSLPTRKSK